MPGDLEIIDPDVCEAATAADVQQEAIEIGFPGVDVRAVLHTQKLDLAAEQFGDFLEPQLLPSADFGIGVAKKEDGEGFSGLGIFRSRQDGSGGQLNSWSIRFDPQPGIEFLDDPGMGNVVSQIDLRAGLDIQLDPFVHLDGMAFPLNSEMLEQGVFGISARLAPRGIGPFKILLPSGLCEEICGE